MFIVYLKVTFNFRQFSVCQKKKKKKKETTTVWLKLVGVNMKLTQSYVYSSHVSSMYIIHITKPIQVTSSAISWLLMCEFCKIYLEKVSTKMLD